MFISYELLLIIMRQYLCIDSDKNLVMSDVNNKRNWVWAHGAVVVTLLATTFL